MRLVLVVPSFPKLSETFIVSKFLGLLARGWDTHVVCGKSEPEQWKHFPELEKHREARGRVRVGWPHRPRWLAAALLAPAALRCLGSNPGLSWRYLGGRRLGWRSVRQLYLDAELVALRPDLVHFEFGALAIGRTHVKELLGCKIVVSFRGYDLNFGGLEEPDYYREVWEQADALHLLGEDLWSRAQRRGCPPNKHHVLIPPSIDTKLFEPLEPGTKETNRQSPRAVRILSVGRLEWKKGLEYGIQAVRLLRDQGLHCNYHLIGDGGYLEALTFARHQMSLESEVYFHGPLPPAEVRQELRLGDIFLHTAVSEGFCNAVLEAQAMALPVVCSDADGLRENVADGVTGFVVPRRDPRALAQKLALLARDPTLRQRMGQAGRQRVLSRFSIGPQISDFEKLYRNVLGCDVQPEQSCSPQQCPLLT